MLDDAVAYMAEEVAMDGSKGTSPTRFLTHFLHSSNPVFSPSFTLSPPTTTTFLSAEAAVDLLFNPPAPVASEEGERYAAFVWGLLVELGDDDASNAGGCKVLIKRSGIKPSVSIDSNARSPSPSAFLDHTTLPFSDPAPRSLTREEVIQAYERDLVHRNVDRSRRKKEIDAYRGSRGGKEGWEEGNGLLQDGKRDGDEEEGEGADVGGVASTHGPTGSNPAEPEDTDVLVAIDPSLQDLPLEQPISNYYDRPPRTDINVPSVLPKAERYRMTDPRRLAKARAGILGEQHVGSREGSAAGDAITTDEFGSNEPTKGTSKSLPAQRGDHGQDRHAIVLRGEEATDFMGLLRMEREGDRVVIRARADRCAMAMTGSYIRARQITPPIWSLLEEICRSRALGLSTIQIGTWAKVDQGTAFYMTRVLLENGYVAKISTTDELKTGARLTNLLVHRRYLPQNPEYQLRLRTLQTKDDAPGRTDDDVNMDENDNAEAGASNHTDLDANDELIPSIATASKGEDPETGVPIFTPCGPIEIRSYGFVRDRLKAVLRAPRLLNHLLLNRDIVHAINFAGTIVTRDRRAIQRHVRKLISDRVVDLVLIPNEEYSESGPYKCIRLAEFRPEGMESTADSAIGKAEEMDQLAELMGDVDAQQDGNEDQNIAEPFDAHRIPVSLVQPNEYRLFQRVQDGGSRGCTYAELSNDLDDMDKKVIESILQRYDTKLGIELPSHLAHYAIVTSIETEGREKRLRAYTLTGYLQLCAERGRTPSAHFAEALPVDPGSLSTLEGAPRYRHLAERHFVIDNFPFRPSQPAAYRAWRKIRLPETEEDEDAEHSDPENGGLAYLATGAIATESGGINGRAKIRAKPPPIKRKPKKIGPGTITIGRPRRFIKMIGLDGEQVKRITATLVPVHPLLPDVMMRNSETGVFFNVPVGYDGTGAPEKPAGWDTATEPTVVYIPGTRTEPTLTGSVSQKMSKKMIKSEKQTQAALETEAAKVQKAEAKALKKAIEAQEKAAKRGRKRKQDVVADGMDLDAEPDCDPEEPAQPPVSGPSTKRRRTRGSSPPAAVVVEVELPSRRTTFRPAFKNGISVPRTQQDTGNPETFSPAVEQKQIHLADTMFIDAPPQGGAPAGSSAAQATVAVDVDNRKRTAHMPARTNARSAAPGPTTSIVPASQLEEPAAVERDLSDSGVAAAPDPNLEHRPAKKARIHKTTKGINVREELDDTRGENILQFLNATGKVCGAGMSLSSLLFKWNQQRSAPGEKISQMAKPTVRKWIRRLIAEGKLLDRKYAIKDDYGRTHQVEVILLPGASEAAIDDWVEDEKLRRSRLPEPQKAPVTFAGAEGVSRITTGDIQEVRKERRIPSDLPVQYLAELPIEQARGIYGNDWRVTSQLYGYVGGIVARSSYLHSFAVDFASKKPFVPCSEGVMVPIKFFIDELPVSVMARSIAIGKYDTALEALIKDPVRGQLPMSAPYVREHLRMYRHARCRVLSLLSFLVQEQVARPCTMLRSSRTPGQEPAFDRSVTDLRLATHLHFSSTMPVYAATEGQAQEHLIAVVPARTGEDVLRGWQQTWLTAGLQTHSVQRKAIRELRERYPLNATEVTGFSKHRTGRCDLANPKVWAKVYVLAPVQKRYLRHLVDPDTRASPLDSSDPEVLQAVAHRIMAPEAVVKRYLQRLVVGRQKEHDVDTLRETVRQPSKMKHSRSAIMAEIRGKMEARQEQLQVKWSTDLEAVLQTLGQESSPELLRYLEPLRSEFLKGNRTFTRGQILPVVKAHFDKFATILEQQVKAKAVRPSATALQIVHQFITKTANTRIRWTAQMAELARDGFVIIEHRVRLLQDVSEQAKRFAAYLHLFPGHPSVKQIRDRVVRWRKEDVNNANYLENLADSWEALYEQHKGTAVLPDPHPDSVSAFPVADWIVFMRQNVRKGLLSRDRRIRPDERLPLLPMSAAELEKHYAVDPKAYDQELTAELFWKRHVSDERRARAVVLESSLVDRSTDGEYCTGLASTDAEARAIAAIKMVVGTPIETFDVCSAGSFLAPFPKDLMVDLIDRMEKNKVLVRAERRERGPEYMYGERYIRDLARPHPISLHRDAEHMVDTVPEEYTAWRMDPGPGEFAGLMSLISEDMLDLNFSASQILSDLHPQTGLSTKELDDDMIEPSVLIRRKAEPVSMVIPERPASLGVATMAMAPETADMDELEQKVTRIVRSAGGEGVRLDTLQDACETDRATLIGAVRLLLKEAEPSVILVGYEYPTLVDAEAEQESWSVACEESGSSGTLYTTDPRQWLDLYGNRLEESWEGCMKVIRGLIVQRPGISERVIRDLVDFTFDRLEVNDLLQTCLDDEKAFRSFASDAVAREAGGNIVGIADPKLETDIFYMPDPMW